MPGCRSARLDIVDTALSLVTDLTGHIIELETRLASHLPLMNEENHLHRQLDDLQQLDKHLQSIEKSIKELLGQSHQLGNERLTRISEQLAARWKQIHGEINQRLASALFTFSSRLRPVLSRKRSITQCVETYRSFETLYEQEERIVENCQRRMETLEPVPNDPAKLRSAGKTVAVTQFTR